MDPSYWNTGFNVLNNLAASGAFGSDGRRVAQYINPPTAVSQPAQAPPPAPVSGQLSVNPAPTAGGFMGHLRTHWGKYAIALGVVVALAVAVKITRK